MDAEKLDNTLEFLANQQASLTVKLDRLHEEVQLLVRVSARHHERQLDLERSQAILASYQEAFVQDLNGMRENMRKLETSQQKLEASIERLEAMQEVTQRQIQALTDNFPRRNGQKN